MVIFERSRESRLGLGLDYFETIIGIIREHLNKKSPITYLTKVTVPL